MHIKYRNGQTMLYRSEWVKKGAEGNTHGFSRQKYIGSLPEGSELAPTELISRLESDELATLSQKVLLPAKAARLAKEADEEQRRLDPVWRLDEAARLVKDAAVLSSANKRVSDWRVRAVIDALAGVEIFGDQSSPAKRDAQADPLAEALKALQSAAHAIAKGHYGRAKEGAARNSTIYKAWLQITAHIDGEAGPESLLRSLQSMGWVKARNSR